MLTNVEQYKCGGCGNETVKVYAKEGIELDGEVNPLLLECTKCKSITTVEIIKPRMVFGWGDGADGIFTGWGN